MCPFKSVVLYNLGKYQVVKLLDPRLILFLTFWGISILFSRLAAPVYNPPTVQDTQNEYKVTAANVHNAIYKCQVDFMLKKMKLLKTLLL